MWIFRVNRLFRNSFRLISILFIITKHLLKNSVYSNRFLRRIIDPKRKNLTSRSERIRFMIEDLGPTFIKFGQIIADRPDLVSEQLRNELKKLQSSARPFDNAIAYRIIEEELGDPLHEVFEQLDHTPIASASIAQVYKAVLRNGETVAVKVQRPHIKQKISIDLVLIKILAEQVVKSYPELASFNVIEFVEDFGVIMKKELDFTNEASNMMRFAEIFKHDDYCYIPKVYSNYTTQKILVMEFVTGIEPDAKNELIANGYDVKQIAVNGTNIILKMILQHGFFHADPHAGNLLIRENNQVVLLDHGMTASLKPAQIQALINFMLGFARQDTHRITKALLALLNVNFYKEQADLEFEIGELIQKYSYIPYDKVDISSLMADTFKVILRHGLKVPTNLYMLLKALGTIQKFAEALEADISIINMIEPYAKEKIKEKFSFDAIINKVINSAEDYLYIVDRLPTDIKEIVNNLRTGVLKHEINFREDSFTNKALRQNFNRLAYVFILGLLMICATLLMIYQPNSEGIKILFYSCAAILVWTGFKLLFNTKFK
ncbi:ubiquinone biosynthesis protein [Lacibacter cauensis]|uniref:Ubiquinone biosynthesis protein n=1 Tax=Lacibacter cauensis TaxID=510947 RepID=A0A562SFU5_9BACT|nr:AarF/UbiB family protein [Lacibacter cauensis]TWI80172.1 ubiquinone biosynthesis protein [Lacibacter cauensis]